MPVGVGGTRALYQAWQKVNYGNRPIQHCENGWNEQSSESNWRNCRTTWRTQSQSYYYMGYQWNATKNCDDKWMVVFVQIAFQLNFQMHQDFKQSLKSVADGNNFHNNSNHNKRHGFEFYAFHFLQSLRNVIELQNSTTHNFLVNSKSTKNFLSKRMINNNKYSLRRHSSDGSFRKWVLEIEIFFSRLVSTRTWSWMNQRDGAFFMELLFSSNI